MNDPHVVAGALLAVGVVNCCVQNENDPAFALLYESVSKDNPAIRVCGRLLMLLLRNSAAALSAGHPLAPTRATCANRALPLSLDSLTTS